MKKGGALPSTKGSSKAGMQSKQGRNFLLPKSKPKKGIDPKKFYPMPKPKKGKEDPREQFGRPRPMPKPQEPRRPKPKKPSPGTPLPSPKDRVPKFSPMPYKKPRLPKEIEKFLMDMPRKMRPAMKKDGGEMKFGAAADVNKIKEGLKSLGSVGAGVGVGKLYDAIKKLKPAGRINMDDIKRTLESMKKAKKIDMSPGRRKAMTGSETGKTRGEKLAESLKNRPPMKKPKAVRRQMAKKVSKRLI